MKKIESSQLQTPIKFGTSGLRGRWGIDFVESRAKWVTQAICDYLKSEGLQDRIVIIGYDSRKHADEVACWSAQVCILNGFGVHFTARDTPTPALAYYALEYLGEDQVAGIINCTSSHNPVEWHGIKFSPHNGCPAPPSITDFIETRANQHQRSKLEFPKVDLSQARSKGQLREFDPMEDYCQWILDSGVNDSRIKLNLEAMQCFFRDKKVIIDEMHGTGRGYLRRILDEIGIPHEVIHGERDPRLGGLVAASPEEPHIEPLKQRVKESGAILGVGLDTDADRFGVVNKGGHYIHPNQVLAMLTKYLGVDGKLKGRIATSHVSTHLVETIAGDIPGNDEYKPYPGVIPPYIRDPQYQVIVGNPNELATQNVFTVSVGLKHIVQVPQMDRAYNVLKDPGPDWRYNLLLGGEEASGLTTKGHVPDKDGIWANLLIMDMMSYYNKTLGEIWEDVTRRYWPSHTKRVNLDVPELVKEKLIDSFLNEFKRPMIAKRRLGPLRVIYVGGIHGRLVELRLQDNESNTNYFLHIRPSGTEPILRIYIETMSEKTGKLLEKAVISKLGEVEK